MLILTRKPGESLYIGDVKVTVVEVKGSQIRLGIDAPKEIRIYREEIYMQILEENKKAAETAASGGLEGLAEAWKDHPEKGTMQPKQLGSLKAMSATQGDKSDLVVRKKKKSDE